MNLESHHIIKSQDATDIMITVYWPHVIIPGRIAAFLVACILFHGSLSRSKGKAAMPLVEITTKTYDKESHLRRNLEIHKVPPVAVSVYVESLCKDSKQYVSEELIPTFQALGPNVMDLSLIVFGNSRLIEETNALECQHGPAECDGNSYMQCAVDIYQMDPARFLPFIQCLFETLPMGHADQLFSPNVYAHCALHAALDWRALRDCHNDPTTSWELQMLNRRKTPVHDFIPWVVVQDNHVSESASLLQVVCKAYRKQGGEHSVCQSRTSSGPLQTFS